MQNESFQGVPVKCRCDKQKLSLAQLSDNPVLLILIPYNFIHAHYGISDITEYKQNICQIRFKVKKKWA